MDLNSKGVWIDNTPIDSITKTFRWIFYFVNIDIFASKTAENRLENIIEAKIKNTWENFCNLGWMGTLTGVWQVVRLIQIVPEIACNSNLSES